MSKGGQTMRMMGVGLLAFLLAGLLILLGQSGAFGTAWDRMTGRDRQQFDDYQAAVAANFDVEGRDVFAAHSDIGSPMILSGLPSYLGTTYRLPVDSRPVSGRYRIVFSSDVADGVEGVLRVSVNGVRRADILLTEGRHRSDAEIELTANELAAGLLNINLSLEGRGLIAECTPDDALAAVVEIESETGLRLSLTENVKTVRDRLALWGDRVPVEWGDGGADALRNLVTSARLVEKGYVVSFRGQGLSGDALADFASEVPLRGGAANLATYPIPLTSDSSNRGMRRFDRQTTWRLEYAAGDLPDGALPAALDLRMAMGPVGADQWHDLTVSINDHLLMSRRLTVDSERFNQSIAIPADFQRSQNQLVVTLTANDADDVRCGANNNSFAEMLDETVLRGGGPAASDPVSLLLSMLRGQDRVSLVADELTQADAQAAAGMLALLEPRGLHFVSGQADTRIEVMPGSRVEAAMAEGGVANSWIVYLPADRDEGVIVRRLADYRMLEVPALALLITLPNSATRGAVGPETTDAGR